MGRIKSAAIKKTATKLVDENPDLFSGNFEKDKKVLQGVVPNKKVRNLITGYIARLSKKRK